MKKFLVFLASIIVVVSLGLTTYYFLRNDEVINFKVKEIYCNVGDVIAVDDLGKVVIKEHHSTTYNYNAGGEEVMSLIQFNNDEQRYEVKNGGETTVVIKTSNKRCPEFKITVHIGDGSKNYPYFIKTEGDLNLIGNTYALTDSYILRNDIVIVDDFKPIGFNAISETWVGFKGSFDGAGHTISGLKVNGSLSSVGLFSSLNGATVKDLTVTDISIKGAYNYAGVLAGQVENSTISNVKISNSEITNLANNSFTGGLAGAVLGANSSVEIAGVENVNIALGEGETLPTDAVIGGLVGETNLATIKATYVKDTNITVNGTALVGGHTGKFIISVANGSIQQSYAVVNCEYENFGAFIGLLDKNDSAEKYDYLKYLVGNYAVTNGKAVIKTYSTELFPYLEDESRTIYSLVSVADKESMLAMSEYVFYAMNSSQKTLWDKNVWNFVAGQLPELKLDGSILVGIKSEYLLKDLDEQEVADANTFVRFISACRATDGKILNKKFILTSDIDLSGEPAWEPIDLENSVIDGGNFTITGLNLTSAADGNVAMFGTVNNSQVKNLNLANVKVNVQSEAINVGTVAAVVKSTNESTSSSIENVTVSFAEPVVVASATNFGGLVAVVENNGEIRNNSVFGLNMAENANITNVAGIVADLKSGVVSKNTINATGISGKTAVAGLVAINNGTVAADSNSVVVVNYSNNGIVANVAGLVAVNNGTINGGSVNVTINILATDSNILVGGVAGTNNGKISQVTISGNGIGNAAVVANELKMGGVVAVNAGAIDNTNCLVNSVGTFSKGKKYQVAGIAVDNKTATSTISKCVAGANLYGNTVAGVVVNMDNASSIIDQVLVAKFNLETKTISANSISGDTYVAGVVYNLAAGKVSNIQTKSEIEGLLDETVASLVVLLFPNQASFTTAAIDSSFKGNGKFYKETWTDYTGTEVSNVSNNYNIYGDISSAGTMQGVIINKTTADKNGEEYKSAFFVVTSYALVYRISSYNYSKNQNNFKDVTEAEFRNAATFKAAITIVVDGTGIIGLTPETFTYNSTFDFQNRIWVENNGALLGFVASL